MKFRTLSVVIASLFGCALLVPVAASAYDNSSVFSPGQLGAVTVHADKAERTLITNVNVFDGRNEKLTMNANVLIEGELIKSVSTETVKADGATVIDGGGRTLMPGMIDGHAHVMINATTARARGSTGPSTPRVLAHLP